MRYLLGFDIGSSSVKGALLETDTGRLHSRCAAPQTEMEISAPRPGWAEQDPESWWQSVRCCAAELCRGIDPAEVAAIGLAYQMHGLVLVDQSGQVLRPAIIWCDGRAVEIGRRAFQALGTAACLSRLLNSPGNFTASKLRWVQEHEPGVYERIHQVLLPGDYIAYRMSGAARTTISGLSEAILWNFQDAAPEVDLLKHYEIEPGLLPPLVDSFGLQGELTRQAAAELGLMPGTPITYRAGDQPNNALALNVLRSGEAAATAGTSGVIYGVGPDVRPDPDSRVNVFAHPNYSADSPVLGVLLCINGAGCLMSWLRRCLGELEYSAMNELAAQAPPGADGLMVFPFGNGPERILRNNDPGASIRQLRFNRHGLPHVLRAAQEGIVFGLRCGLDIMLDLGLEVETIRAGAANLFLSTLFRTVFAAATGCTLELYDTDGAQGAARAAGVGAGFYADFNAAAAGLRRSAVLEPDSELHKRYQDIYQRWIDGVMQEEA